MLPLNQNPLVKPLLSFNERMTKTFDVLPETKPIDEVIKRVALVTIAIFAYTILSVLGLTGFILSPCFRLQGKKIDHFSTKLPSELIQDLILPKLDIKSILNFSQSSSWMKNNVDESTIFRKELAKKLLLRAVKKGQFIFRKQDAFNALLKVDIISAKEILKDFSTSKDVFLSSFVIQQAEHNVKAAEKSLELFSEDGWVKKDAASAIAIKKAETDVEEAINFARHHIHNSSALSKTLVKIARLQSTTDREGAKKIVEEAKMILKSADVFEGLYKIVENQLKFDVDGAKNTLIELEEFVSRNDEECENNLKYARISIVINFLAKLDFELALKKLDELKAIIPETEQNDSFELWKSLLIIMNLLQTNTEDALIYFSNIESNETKQALLPGICLELIKSNIGKAFELSETILDSKQKEDVQYSIVKKIAKRDIVEALKVIKKIGRPLPLFGKNYLKVLEIAEKKFDLAELKKVIFNCKGFDTYDLINLSRIILLQKTQE